MSEDWLRVRFQANYDDFRCLKVPPPGPYWCSGYAGDESYSIVVAYVKTVEQVYEFWPEAADVDVMDENVPITFSDRFQKPDWWKGETS